MIGSIFSAVTLASLPLIFVSSDDKPASLDLPPFEKEVYLSVTAKWAPNDCVNVTVVTNLPKGTWYGIIAQRRRKPGTLKPFESIGQIFRPEDRVRSEVTSKTMDFQEIFCSLVHARKHGGKQDTYGLLIAVIVSHSSYFPRDAPYEQALEEQALRIGRYGALLRGPLVRPQVVDSEHRKYAESKTFILEPLPLLPEEDDTEQIDEAGVDSE